MKLVSLEIERFRNLKNLNLTFPSDKKAIILSGKNGIGKSTILDSILWLLCDETIVYGGQNDDNLDKNDRKSPINVCATFVKDDGSTLKLRRALTPKFTRSGEFSKYEPLLEINDVSYPVKQYFTRIKNQELGINSENAPDVTSFNTLRCILDYNYINNIKYQVAREKIEKILKITRDEDLVNNPEYSLIKDDLKAALFDVSKIKTKFNKQKSTTEGILDKANDNYLIMKNAFKPIDEDELAKLEQQKRNIEEQNYEHSVEYKVAIKNRYELRAKMQQAKTTFDSVANKYLNKLKEYNDITNYKKQYSIQLNGLKEQFITIKNSVSKCPKCNYELNGESIRKKLDEINVKGQATKTELEKCDSKLNAIDIKALEKEYKEAETQYHNIYNELANSESQLQILINKEDEQNRIFYNEKALKVTEINGKINELKSSSNSLALEEKEKELKIIRGELATIEQKIALLKEYEQNKNKAINIRIKEVFPNLDFRLWEESDTGAIQNTCKVYLKNVGYEGINTGHKIMVGLEIINSLRKAFGLTESLPIIFDNVSDLDKNNFQEVIKDSKNQIITAVVSDSEEIKVINL